MAQLRELGYYCFASRGSRGIDVIAVHDDRTLPILVCEVGGRSKVVSAALSELEAAARPIGSRCIVARETARGVWRYHTRDNDGDTRSEENILDLLDFRTATM